MDRRALRGLSGANRNVAGGRDSSLLLHEALLCVFEGGLEGRIT
jgi:hypothetical protein